MLIHWDSLGSCCRVLRWNATKWGRLLVPRTLTLPHVVSVVLVCETHLQDFTGPMEALVAGGWGSYWPEAQETGQGGTSAGTAILYRKHLLVRELDSVVWGRVLDGRNDLRSRIIACAMRVQQVTYLLLEVYMVVG